MVASCIEVRGLRKYFPLKRWFFKKGAVRAVDGVDFEIMEGETLGLVGESGCGKTTIGLSILRLIGITAGSVLFRGTDIFKMSKKELKSFRREAQIIFQNPFTSLDPRMKVRQIVGDPMKIHRICKNQVEVKARVLELFEKLGLEAEHMERYPHEFSGGQRQRIAIARALALRPSFLVLDEPTSSLDLSVQAQILNILQDLQEEFGFTYLFISHNLDVVRHMSDRVAVMYLGKIVELGSSEYLFSSPLHPYTHALFSSIPIPDPKTKRLRIVLSGEVPSPINPPSGCRFHPRCPKSKPICLEKEPRLVEAKNRHYVACHLA